MGYQVDTGDVDELVALLDAVDGIRSVSATAADVQAPGVWVNVQGWRIDKLRGYTVETVIYLVVPDQTPKRSRKALLELLNKVLTVVKPSGRVEPRTVVLPHSPAQLPGLAVPFNVNCTAPEE